MNTWINKPTRALEEFLQTEYQNLLGNGPFSEGNGFEKLGTYKEIIEEHSHCAGCGVALGIRLTMAALPSRSRPGPWPRTRDLSRCRV